MVALCAARGVTFDVCPISNVGLRVVPSLGAHPLRTLIAAGVRCTISTDDPLCFANTLNEEYLAVAHGLGFSRSELARLARAGWEVALLPEAKKQPFLEQIDALIAAG